MATQKEILVVHVQCEGVNGTVGTFLKGKETQKQYTKTFKHAGKLFNSIRFKQLKEIYTIHYTITNKN